MSSLLLLLNIFNKSQSHLALGGIAANMLMKGKSHAGHWWCSWIGCCWVSVGCLQQSVCNSVVTLCNTNFDWGFQSPNFPFLWGTRPLPNTVLLGTTWVSLPNGISFCPTVFVGCTSMTVAPIDGHTDKQRYYSNIFCSRQNCWMPSVVPHKNELWVCINELYFTSVKRLNGICHNVKYVNCMWHWHMHVAKILI